ncbi:MAG: hypothetical protein WC475_02875 [Candidatus Paceibacterota bacterium]
MKFFKFCWRQIRKLLLTIGDIISWIILFVFYYTVFLLFALPFRIFSKNDNLKKLKSGWIIKESALTVLDNFRNE